MTELKVLQNKVNNFGKQMYLLILKLHIAKIEILTVINAMINMNMMKNKENVLRSILHQL